MSDASISTIALERLLPHNMASNEDIQLIMRAIDSEVQSLVSQLGNCRLWSGIDDLPEAVLNLLAGQFKLLELEGWNVATIAAKRAMLKEVLLIYRRKGTPWAIERSLLLIGLVGVIEEWFNHGRDPYTWRLNIIVQPEGVTWAHLHQLFQLVEAHRPARSPLERLSMRATEEKTVYVSGTVQGGLLTTLR